jgi:hypothetical protein
VKCLREILRRKLVRRLPSSWGSGTAVSHSQQKSGGYQLPTICQGNRYSPTKVMQWDSGDLSLIEGVLVQGEAARGAANQKHRRVLKHMRYDKDSGHFVPTEKKKLNRVVGYEVDHDKHRTLREMLNTDNGVSELIVQVLPTTVVDRELVADTGATVVCGGTGLMQ